MISTRPEPQRNPSREPNAWTVNPAVHALFSGQAAVEREGRSERRQQIQAVAEERRRHAD